MKCASGDNRRRTMLRIAEVSVNKKRCRARSQPKPAPARHNGHTDSASLTSVPSCLWCRFGARNHYCDLMALVERCVLDDIEREKVARLARSARLLSSAAARTGS
jgi:hypothetical protein